MFSVSTWRHLSYALFVFCELAPDADMGLGLWTPSFRSLKEAMTFSGVTVYLCFSFHDVTISIDANYPDLLLHWGLLHCDSLILGFFICCILLAVLAVIYTRSSKSMMVKLLVSYSDSSLLPATVVSTAAGF